MVAAGLIFFAPYAGKRLSGCGCCLAPLFVAGVYSTWCSVGLSPLSVKQRAEVKAPKLIARLGSDKSERLKPVLWGKLERRRPFETELARNEFILNQAPWSLSRCAETDAGDGDRAGAHQEA